jgi:hypothetical protein
LSSLRLLLLLLLLLLLSGSFDLERTLNDAGADPGDF